MDNTQPAEITIHRNPALGAAILYWMAEGYESRPESDEKGVLVPWGCLGYALVATDKQRREIPQTAHGKLDKLFLEDHQDWRVRSAEVIREWSPHLWRAIGYGSSAGRLQYEEFRFSTTGSGLREPASEVVRAISKKAGTFGKILAKEGSDEAVSAIVGVDLKI